jgi:hypothetical protein
MMMMTTEAGTSDSFGNQRYDTRKTCMMIKNEKDDLALDVGLLNGKLKKR